jgi:OmpA-OmpF porin, OOP family
MTATNRARARALPAAVVAALVIAAGCTDGGGTAGPGCEATEIPAHDGETVVIEGDPWSGYAPFRDARLLDGTAYTALYVEQLCQEQRAADLTSGTADIAVTTLDQYVLHQPDATVVGVIDQSQGADALVLDTLTYPYLDSVDDLGRLVEEFGDDRPVLAYTGNSPSEMLLNELANTTEELRLTDFDLVSVDQSATAYAMLRSGEAQLAVVWEPDTSTARDAGYTVALSSEEVPDSIVDVIVASNQLIERDPGAVRAVLDAFYTAMDGFLADREALVELIAVDGDLDHDAAESVIDGIKLYGTNDADVFMNEGLFPLDQPQAIQSLEAIGSLLALVHPDIRLDQAAVDGSYIADIAEARYGTGGDGASDGGDGGSDGSTDGSTDE